MSFPVGPPLMSIFSKPICRSRGRKQAQLNIPREDVDQEVYSRVKKWPLVMLDNRISSFYYLALNAVFRPHSSRVVLLLYLISCLEWKLPEGYSMPISHVWHFKKFAAWKNNITSVGHRATFLPSHDVLTSRWEHNTCIVILWHPLVRSLRLKVGVDSISMPGLTRFSFHWRYGHRNVKGNFGGSSLRGHLYFVRPPVTTGGRQ